MGIRSVRVTAARPGPPTGRRVTIFPTARVIIALEGAKEEAFSDGQALQQWVMAPGDALVVRADSWLCPRFHTRHRHLGLITEQDRLLLHWSRCDGDDRAVHPLAGECVASVPLIDGGALHATLRTLGASDGPSMVAGAGPPLLLGALQLVREALTHPGLPPGRQERTWRAAVGYIQENFHLGIGREAVADAFGLSPSYLSRLCRERSRQSFIAYLTGVRLAHAERLLRHVDLPITEVARACGFSEAGYFIRRFRRVHGATPADWRRDRPR